MFVEKKYRYISREKYLDPWPNPTSKSRVPKQNLEYLRLIKNIEKIGSLVPGSIQFGKFYEKFDDFKE